MTSKTFYPTPPMLAARMVAKIDLDGRSPFEINVLDPSAGKGDLIEALNKDRYDGFSGSGTFRDVSAIEIDQDLQATLRGKRIRVIDSDFLTYSGPDKFDLIIANPPFDNGDKHLLKAIDILYRGQIIFLLNAETIRNPYTNTRKALARKLQELNVDIEYIQGAFKDSERPTGVEVALINIKIDRKVENDLFDGCAGVGETCHDEEFEEKYEVSTGKKVEELVAEYNEVVKIGTETIISYFRNYRKIGKWIGLNQEADKYSPAGRDLTARMQHHLNTMLAAVRKTFWRKCLDLPEVTKRMTSAKRDEFDYKVEHQSDMDFTENNIRTFVLNLIRTYDKTLMEAVIDIFDMFTIRHSWDPDKPNEQNVHYFNGWRTNKAFKVTKKVIIPIYGGGYGNTAFFDTMLNKWKLGYGSGKILNDIDKVMNYFDGMNGYYSLEEAITHAFERDEGNIKIESTYFTCDCYKKGTIHLTFNDENILRRFNVAACVGKNWLPCDYGQKPFQELPADEQATAESFEGKKSYNESLRQPLFGKVPIVPLLEEYADKIEGGSIE